MKKMLFAVAFLTATISQAQFYVSATGGYAFGVPSTKISEETINGNQKANYGTFGEGFNTQLRFGYFFNQTWGIDLGLGYLHGAEQVKARQISPTTSPFPSVLDAKVTAAGRVFGLSISAIYNFTDNFYGRFGILTKVGGKTVATAHSSTTTTTPIPAGAVSNSVPADIKANIQQLTAVGYNVLIEQGAKIETQYTENFHGKMPFGTIAALGYKYNINKNISIFAEVEYMNIGVKSNYSQLQEFKQTLDANVVANGISNGVHPLPAGTPLPEVKRPIKLEKTLDQFENGVYNDLRGQTYFTKTTYVDEISATETDRSKKLSDKASYSSLGLNFGVTYQF